MKDVISESLTDPKTKEGLRNSHAGCLPKHEDCCDDVRMKQANLGLDLTTNARASASSLTR